MRLFIAVNLTTRAQKLINDKINLIKKEVKENIKWVGRDKLHITLKFLGDTKKSQLNTIQEIIQQSVKEKKEEYLQVRGISAFPQINQPRVLFIGIDRGKKLLENIHYNLDKKLAKIGFEMEEREFTPHLTFARSRKDTDLNKLPSILKKFDKKYFVNVFTKCTEISLMKSVLKPEGPEYIELFSVSLKKIK